MLVNRLVVLFDVAQQRVLTAAIPCLSGWFVDAPVHFRSINIFLEVNYQISNQLSALTWATGGSAQMHGLATGVGSKNGPFHHPLKRRRFRSGHRLSDGHGLELVGHVVADHLERH